MNANAVEVRDLRVIRGGDPVLHGISLDVPRGSIVGLLGPSGCGKSTLMRSIVGIQVVESGTVTVLGRPAGSRRPAPRDRLRPADALGLPGPDRPREPALLRSPDRRAGAPGRRA